MLELLEGALLKRLILFVFMKKLLLLLSILLLVSAGCGKKQAEENKTSVANKQQTPDVKKVKATQVVYEGGRSVSTNLEQPEGSNALDALKVAAVVEGKQYSSGMFVESIDGIKP